MNIRDGVLVADNQNLEPGRLDPANQPLHAFFNTGGNLAQLSDLAEDNPAVLDYMADAYLQWIDRGADAFRVDTIGWMPHQFWKAFSDRIRARHPSFFLFGENFNFDAGTIAQHQRLENGGISVLDFPGRNAITGVFQDAGSDYGSIGHYLNLTDCTYTNPYELATFYDNHDMARINASDNGFIDAHNWLFTARGIPVVYYAAPSPVSCVVRPSTAATATTSVPPTSWRRATARSIGTSLEPPGFERTRSPCSAESKSPP